MMSSLLVLARQSSTDNRLELLRALAELCVHREAEYTQRERGLLGEVIGALLEWVEPADRAALSRRIAPCRLAFGELQTRLARHEEFDVARPILERCEALDDETLADLAMRMSKDHRLAIAGRAKLAAGVTDILVQSDDGEVVRSVTCNLGARISERCFERILDTAKDDPRLQSALSYRADMPDSAARRALTILAPEHRRRLSGLLAEAGDEPASELQDADAPSRAQRPERPERPERWIGRRQTIGLLAQIGDELIGLETVVLRFARQDRCQDLASVISRRTHLEESAVLGEMYTVDHWGMAVLARALDLSDATAGEIAEMRCRRLHLPSTARDRMVDAWKALDPHSADRMLRLMRIRATLKARRR